jgi:HAD superfamily phosphoserine phosphatase-like hydrolase
MPEQRGPALVVFDVCDTLYSANTTFDFLRFHARTRANGELAERLRQWTAVRSPRGFFAAVILRIFGVDLARTRVIDALRGESHEVLTRSAREYVARVLPAKANAVVHDRLRRHRDQGDRVMLVSSSLDIVIGEIANLLEVEFSASELEFASDRCTGRLRSDLTGRKAAVVQARRGNATCLQVYTDNRTDIDLLRIADHGTVIVPAGERQTSWAGADVEYVRL